MSIVTFRRRSAGILFVCLFVWHFARCGAHFCLSVPSFQAAPATLTCVRSLKCNIQRYQGCYAVKGMCRCAQAWCCNNPFNYSSLQSCLSVAENAVHLGKKSLRKDDQCEHCRVVYGGFAITVGSIATPCDWLKNLAPSNSYSLKPIKARAFTSYSRTWCPRFVLRGDWITES